MNALQRGFETAIEQVAVWGPRVLLGIALLLAGWLVAKLFQRLATKLATMSGVDKPFSSVDPDSDMPVLPPTRLPSRVFGLVVFWVVMLFAVVAFLTTIRLDAVALPIQTVLVGVSEWLPNLFAAAALVVVGWVLASLVRALAVRLLKGLKVDQRLGGLGVMSQAAVNAGQFTSVVGIALYAVVLILFILPAVDVLGLAVIAETAQNTLQVVADAIPGILAAALVLAVAAVIGFVLRPPVTRLLAITGVDGLGKHVGLDADRDQGAATISTVAGHAVFWLILLFAFPAALDRLGLEPLVAPLREAWSSVVGGLPNLAAALAIALAAVILARLLGPLLERLLHGIGFDAILGRIGLAKLQEASETQGERWLPSRIAGATLVLVIYLLMGQEALRVLGLTYMADLVNQMIVYLPNIVVAVAILAVALYVAKFVGELVRQAVAGIEGINAGVSAGAAYAAIVVFGAAMAVDQLAIGGNLVQWAVLLLLGALCLAGAIAAGLGLRPLVEQWAQDVRESWMAKR